VGLTGSAGPWSYDVFAIEAKVTYKQSEQNDFLTSRIASAMDVVNVGGVAKCASADAGCVPYNPWKLGGVTAAQLDYLQAPGLRKGSTSLSMQGASVAVDLGAFGIKSPMAKTGLSLSLGAEHRAEALVLITDAATANGDFSSSSGPVQGLTGDTAVKEVFGELRVPIIDKGLWPELLQATLSGRNASYASGFSANTYGLGLELAPVRQAKFRASFQHGVRAPNLVELFTAQTTSLYGNDEDPCAGATPTRSLADCARTGVTAAQYGTIQDSPAGQYNYLAGGNSKLKPETANSFTLGVVLTPLRSLNVTVDYFDIRVKDTIRNLDPTTTLSKCLDTGNAAFCSLISRDSQGSLWLLPQGTITSTNQNLGSTRASGLDLAVAYSQKLGGKGDFGVNYAATLLRKLEVEEVRGDGQYDCAGLYGPNKCGAPRPKYRHKLRATWNTPWSIEAALTWRHLSSVLLQTTSGNPLLSGSVSDKERELGAQNYLDLAASWKASRGLTLSVGINNLLDKDPPITSKLASAQGNGNTYPAVYDALGRKVFLTGSYKF
jgi:outer membrane receptor protein involved in Fe transport